MDFEPNWSGFFVVKGGSGSGAYEMLHNLYVQCCIVCPLDDLSSHI